MLRLILLLAATSSPSERSAPVIVVIDPASTSDALVAFAELRDRLAARDARLVDARSIDDTHDRPRRAAERTLTLAHKAREAGELDEAKGRYSEALTAFESTDLRRSFDAFLEALAWSALLERDDQAMRSVFTMRPQFTFPAGQLAADASRWVEEQRAAKAAAKKVDCDVQSASPAVVWVDGERRGTTPLRLESVLAGRHRITAWSPGYALLQIEETLTSDARLELELKDTPKGGDVRAGLEAVRGGFRTGEYLLPIHRLTDLVRADEVVVVGIQTADGARKMTVVRMPRDGRASTATRSLGAGDLIVDTALPIITALYDQPIGVDLAASATPFTRRNLAYVAWGAGAVTLLVGVVLAGLAAGGFIAANQLPPSRDAEYRDAFYSARTKLGASYVMFGLASVGAGLGTGLFVTSKGPTAPDRSPEPAL